MKKPVIFAFFLLFFLAVSGLFAQIPHDAGFYVLPVTGAGTRAAKTFFSDRVSYEIAFQDYLLFQSRRESDYVIRCRIHSVKEEAEPVNNIYPRSSRPRIKTSDNRREFLSWEVRDPVHFIDTSSNRTSHEYRREFVLNIRLMRSGNNEVLSERLLVFNDLNDDAARAICEIMSDFFNGKWEPERPEVVYIPPFIAQGAQTPLEPEPEPAERPARQRAERSGSLGFSDDWRDKLFFFEYCLIWAPRENVVNNEIAFFNIGLGFALELQMLNFLALDVGVQFVQEISGGSDNRDLIVEFPASLKIVLKPFNKFMIEIFGGVSYNYFTFLKKVTPSGFSYFGGVELCVNTFLGTLVIEPRVTRDWTSTILGPGLNYKRTVFQLAIGFKSGFIPRLVRKPD